MSEKPKYEDAAEFLENIKGWVCKTCHQYFGVSTNAEHLARYCCSDDQPCECGNRKTRGWSYCKDCREKADAKRLQDAFDKAELIEYCGPFCVDDKWFQDAESYHDYCECEEVDPDEYAFVPEWESLRIDIDDAVQNAIENLSCEEDVDVDVPNELRAAVKAFNESCDKNRIGVYNYSTKRKFRLTLNGGKQ